MGADPQTSRPAMQNRLSKIAHSLKEIGDIEVTDWDFMELMHKDIKDLELARSLRRLGGIRVTDWEFKDVLPAVNKLAQKEIDLVDLVKRTAGYRVMEWDFRDMVRHEPSAPVRTPEKSRPRPTPDEIQALILRLKEFLQFVAVSLIDEPKHAQIRIREIEPAVLRVKLVLVKRDAATLIGHGGHSAAAIRNLMQASGRLHGVQVLLRILSHEEDALETDEPAA